MRGLGIIIAGTDVARYRIALTLAAAQAALGGRTRILFDGESVCFATSLDELLESCLELGANVMLCQSGLAAAGLEADRLDPRFAYGGMVGWLADLGEDRLILA
jgi:peroxiredoxin family protein